MNDTDDLYIGPTKVMMVECLECGQRFPYRYEPGEHLGRHYSERLCKDCFMRYVHRILGDERGDLHAGNKTQPSRRYRH